MICCPSENQIIDCIVSEVSKSHITCFIEYIDTAEEETALIATDSEKIGNKK